MKNLLVLVAALWSVCSFAKSISTNEVSIPDPPDWLTSAKVHKVVDRVQKVLQWDIRKVQMNWYTDEAEFEKSHGFGPAVIAFSRKQDKSVNMGPRINSKNFESVFGHELTHVIIFQKYGNAIPKWLEEGLANYVGRDGKVDYKWLARQPARDVTTLSHPFQGMVNGSDTAKFHYMASTALAEMIASKCDLEDLLQLSVGEKFVTYLENTCEVKDVNGEYTAWVKKKAGLIKSK